MDYIFSGREFPKDFETTLLEVLQESFNYEEFKVQDHMMFSPSDIASVVCFFINVMIVANVETAHEVKFNKKSPGIPFFATKVASLFETLEDKTSTQHKTNIALYGKL